MRTLILAAAACLLLTGSASAAPLEPITGLPCEGCEAVFEGLPAQLKSRARIAPASEPGQPLVLRGTVSGSDGKPRKGVVVYAYQTNARGIYPTSERANGRASHRHGLLRGWALTDAEGRYAFDTIRPAGYPGTDLPQHIHMHVIERGCATYYIDDVLFTDDPRLTAEQIRRHDRKRAGSGIATPAMENRTWQVRRDIRLGMNIPGYPGCSRRAGSQP
jgi:protocatechuate 3,4-dioxygenase beta subunit